MTETKKSRLEILAYYLNTSRLHNPRKKQKKEDESGCF